MSYVHWKVDYIPFTDNEWPESGRETLTRFRDVNLIQEIGDGKDSFSFNITNFNGELDDKFNPNDKIIVSRATNTTVFTDDDVLMVGTIKDIPETKSGNKADIKVEGYNYSESVMDAIVFFEAQNSTPPEIIQQALDNAAAKNQNFKVNWHPDNDAAIAGLTYPRYTERFFNQTLKKVIERYSTKPKVGDNNSSYYYIDNANNLVWRPQTSTISYTYNYNAEPCKQIKFGRDTKGVRNYIILKGGQDASGSQIQTRYVEYSSVSKYGMKYQFLVSENNTAKNLIDVDVKNTYGDDKSPDGYPLITTSAFTTAWRSQAVEEYTTNKYNVTVTPGAFVTINQGTEADNKKAYNEVLREEIKKALYAEGQEFVRNRRFGKLEIELEFRAGSKSWQMGDLISCTLPQIGVQSRPLRVSDVQYTTSSDTYTLVEDEGQL